MRYKSTERPAYGAAILAAVGCGLYKTVEDACRALINISDEVNPISKNVEKYDKVYEVYKSLYYSLKDKFEEISNL